MAGVGLGGLVMLFYPMKKGGHEAIVEQLEQRRATPPDAVADPQAV
jgi:hypothetical protein